MKEYVYPEKRDSIEYKLQAPFEPHEIEWRPQQVGEHAGKPWMMVLAYVQARAIQSRLDDVFGYDGWKTEYLHTTNGVICRLGVKGRDGSWVVKEDGSPETDIESFKGGISGAFKRVAASGFGIGRYLYYLESGFVNCSYSKEHGLTEKYSYRDKDANKWKKIFWQIPTLPSFALPYPKK